jgi:imidazole glycerol-phosphate synthase subunit HisF
VNKSLRIIARIDVKSDRLIKSVQFDGMRDLGKAVKFTQKYFKDGADELLILDSVASLFGRNTAVNFLKDSTKKIFIPVTLGGGISEINQVNDILNNGADKICINTGAVKNKKILKKIAEKFGSQCLVSSITAKKKKNNKWEVFIDKGREATKLDLLDWAKFCERNGAGEILITSIDQEGTELGFDYELCKIVSDVVKIPVIAGGGCGKLEHLQKVFSKSNVNAVSIASPLHYNRLDVKKIKKFLIKKRFNLRY